jgi:endoglucanase
MNRRDVIVGGAALAACAPAASQAPAPFPMRRGVNLGNALEAPNEGEWGYRIEADHLSAIAAAGFDGVRVPVRWDAHMDAAGRIAPAHLARVAEVVGWALERGLKAQLDVHHYAALIEDPRRETPRFLALWRQIAERFAAAPPALMFELLNEPHGRQWRGRRLADLQSGALEIVRESNPTRLVVLGPGDWQSVEALAGWTPPADPNIAASVHYYEPHDFTHQNAEWLGADAPRFDRSWGGFDDRAAVHDHLDQARRWGLSKGCALQLGEFGVIRNAPADQRAIWLHVVRSQCEQFGIAWCVWDFAGAFAVFDPDAGDFVPRLREALFA